MPSHFIPTKEEEQPNKKEEEESSSQQEEEELSSSWYDSEDEDEASETTNGVDDTEDSDWEEQDADELEAENERLRMELKASRRMTRELEVENTKLRAIAAAEDNTPLRAPVPHHLSSDQQMINHQAALIASLEIQNSDLLQRLEQK